MLVICTRKTPKAVARRVSDASEMTGCVLISILERREDELRHQLGVANGSTDDHTNEDDRRVRRHLEAGPFGSYRGMQYASSLYEDGSHFRQGAGSVAV